MIEEKFDAIVIGAGMAGNAAAYTMASRGLKVLQLERGEYPGSKNVQGGILYADMLEKIIPNFREEAPLERHLVEQRFWMMTDRSHTGLQYGQVFAKRRKRTTWLSRSRKCIFYRAKRSTPDSICTATRAWLSKPPGPSPRG